VIEDEFLIALDIEAALREGGFDNIQRASTESAAFGRIEGEVWDLVILDANLNGRPVGGIAKALQARGAPFVVVTGYGRRNLPPEIENEPVVEKPFDRANLLRTVKSVCAR